MKKGKDKPAYILEKELASGVIGYYYNRPARHIPEGCEVFSSNNLGSEKWEAYAEAKKRNKYYDEFKISSEIVNKKSVSYLWKEYQDTRKYKKVGERTKSQYKKTYDYLSKRQTAQGLSLIEVSLDLFTHKAVDKLLERFLEKTNIFDVKRHFDFLRMIYKFGIKERVFRSDIENPFSNMGIELPKSNKKKNIIQEHVEALISKAKEINKAHVALAVELNYYLCQRPEDVLEIRKEHFYWSGDDLFVTIEQNKVDGVVVNLPIPKHLHEAVLSKDDYIICDDRGNFSVDRFGRHFKIVKDALGGEFKEYEWRTLRHTGGNAMLEAGASIEQVTAVTGHKDPRTFNEYYKVTTEKMTKNALNMRLKSQNEDKKESE